MNIFFRITPVFIITTLVVTVGLAQSGELRGKVTDRITKEPIPFANIVLESTNQGTTSDFDGNFSLNNITPGIYTVLSSVVGYQKVAIAEVSIGSTNQYSSI